MIQRRQETPPNDPVRSDGDAGFVGVNLKLAPDKVGVGIAAGAVNKVFRDGRAATRGGVQTPAHFQPAAAVQLVAPFDFLYLRMAWQQETNGVQLGGTVKMPVFSPPFDALKIGPYWHAGGDPGYRYPDTSNWWIAVPTGTAEFDRDVTTGQVVWVIRYDKLDFDGAAELHFDFALWWIGASQSAGLNGQVTLELTPYIGGTVTDTDSDFALTGAAGTTVRRTVQLYSDTLVSKKLTTRPATFRLTMTSPGGQARLSESFPPADLALIGTSGFMAEAPAVTPGSILSAGIMAERDGREFVLLARSADVWQVRDGTTWRQKSAEVGGRRSEVGNTSAPSVGDFVQFAGRVVLFRGADATRLKWDGGASDEWEIDMPGDPADGTRDLPNASTAEVINNRLALIHGRNEVILSEIARFRYDPLTSLFRINTGANETLVRLLPFTATSLLVFTTRSIYLLDNISGTLSNVALAEVNRRLGLAARLAVAQVGADVFFLAREGVFRISQVVESRIATAPVAVSDAVEPFLRERVNWRAVEGRSEVGGQRSENSAGACACVVGEYFYLALPIDGSAVNNALLLYNLTSQQWEGHHTFPAGVALSRLLATDYNGRRRLFAADYGKGCVYLVHEGTCDRIGAATYEISDELTTRGYTFEGLGFKLMTLAEVTIDTWRPKFSVTLRCEGVNEASILVTDREKDRRKSYQFGRGKFTLDNSGDNHGQAHREDYSVLCGDGIQLQSGVQFDRQQQTQERFRVRAAGRYAQLVISSTQGRCDVVSTRVEARHKENRRRVGQ